MLSTIDELVDDKRFFSFFSLSITLFFSLLCIWIWLEDMGRQVNVVEFFSFSLLRTDKRVASVRRAWSYALTNNIHFVNQLNEGHIQRPEKYYIQDYKKEIHLFISYLRSVLDMKMIEKLCIWYYFCFIFVYYCKYKNGTFTYSSLFFFSNQKLTIHRKW